MSLLAYSVRRAFGALAVFLLVIFLLMLGVGHIPANIRHSTPRDIDLFPWEQWQTQPHTWTVAAVEVGIAVVLLLGLIALWRIWKPPFWALLGIGSVFVAFGVASLGVALANQDYRRLTLQDRATCERACIPPAIERGIARQYNRGIDPTPWWIAGGISTALGVTVMGAALMTRRPRRTREG